MRKKITFLIFLLMFLSFTSLAWAELQYSASISIREEYNDNIFLTASDEEDDFITNIFPAINLGYKTDFLTLSLDYGLNFRFYVHHPDLNETSPSNTQRAKLETTVSPYKNIIFIKVLDEYTRVPIDERRQVALDNTFVNLTDTNHFLVNPFFEYPLSRTLKVNAGYQYENIWYRDNRGDNTNNHLITSGLTKELSSNINASLAYSFLVHRPEQTENYESQNAMFVIRYQVTPRMTLNGSIGRTWFNYRDRPDTDSPVWNAQATYQLTENVSLGGGYSQIFEDSVDVGTYKAKNINISITRQGYIPVSLSAFKNISTYLTTDREDRATGVALNTSVPITPRITIGCTGTYTYYKFLPEKEKVNRYGASLSSDFALGRIILTFGYTYNLNDSTVDNNDYKNNVIWVQARYNF